MTTLVTGATGFVGSAVARRLLSRGSALRAFVRPGGDRRNLEGLDIELAEGDLRDAESRAAALRGCRALYHVAADYRLWVRDPATIYKVNVEGTRDLFRQAAEAGVERIVYTSSVATLGIRPDGRPADEETPVSERDMIGHYKRSKFLAEREVERLALEEGLPVVIVNPSTPIGPRDVKPTPTGRTVLVAAKGKMPAYVETGLNVVHVDDVAEGHRLAFEKGRVGERYILGGEDMKLVEILRIATARAGRRAPGFRLPNRLLVPLAVLVEGFTRVTGGGEPFITRDGLRMARKLMFFSSAKAEAELGYRARPAAEGIEAAVDWFKAEGYCK